MLALLLPLAIVGVITLEAWALGIARPDFSLVRTIEHLSGRHITKQLPPNLGLLLIPQLLLTALITTPLLWGEEFGWRGYLQPRLFPGRPLLGAIGTGVIWGVWHYPLILRGYDFGDERALGAAIFPVSTIFFSIIFGWLKDRTGSIWVCSLAHSSTNAVGASLTLLWFYGAGVPVLTAYVGMLAWPSLLLICVAIVKFGRGSGPPLTTPLEENRTVSVEQENITSRDSTDRWPFGWIGCTGGPAL